MQNTQRTNHISKVNLLANSHKLSSFINKDTSHRRAWNNLSLNNFKNSLEGRLVKSNVQWFVITQYRTKKMKRDTVNDYSNQFSIVTDIKIGSQLAKPRQQLTSHPRFTLNPISKQLPYVISPKTNKQLKSILRKYSQANCKKDFSATINSTNNLSNKKDNTREKNAVKVSTYLNHKRLANAFSRNTEGKFHSNVVRSNSQTYSLTKSSLSNKNIGLKEIRVIVLKESKNCLRIKYLMPIKEQYEDSNHQSKLMISSTTRHYNAQKINPLGKATEQTLSLNLDRTSNQMNIVPFKFAHPTFSCAPIIKGNSIEAIKSSFIQSFRTSIPHNESTKQTTTKKPSEYNSPKLIASQNIKKGRKQFNTISLLKKKCLDSDVIYNEVKELRKKCNVKKEESIFLVPTLRNTIPSMKMTITEPSFLLFCSEI